MVIAGARATGVAVAGVVVAITELPSVVVLFDGVMLVLGTTKRAQNSSHWRGYSVLELVFGD